MMGLAWKYDQRIKDLQIIYAQSHHEYNERYAYPKLYPLKHTVATQVDPPKPHPKRSDHTENEKNIVIDCDNPLSSSKSQGRGEGRLRSNPFQKQE